MIWKIPQHIYTSTGRMNFETVAVSPEISSETLRQLEVRAQLYPDKRFWGDEESPPFLVRGFQLVGGTRPQYAVSLTYYVGAGLNRPEGNYLSHSYVIDKEFLEQQNYNLPWIAACLPCYFTYYPSKGTGVDKLDPLEMELDPLDQLKLFSFVAHELTEAGLYRLANYLMAHLAGPNSSETLDLELPSPHSELAPLYAKEMGQPAESAPTPDALRLLRLAGLLTVLPVACKNKPTFVVNEGARAFEASNLDTYSFRVSRVPGSLPANDVDVAPWFHFCVKLAVAGRFTELSDFQAWLSSVLPSEDVPSYQTLNKSFNFDRRLLGLKDELPSRIGNELSEKRFVNEVLSEVVQLEKCRVNIDAVYRRAWPLLEQLKKNFEPSQGYIAFSRLAANSDDGLPSWLFDGILDCLLSTNGEIDRLNQAYWDQLPEAVKGQVWEQSFEEKKLPGYIPLEGNWPAHLDFALNSLKPRFLPAPVDPEIFKHLHSRLGSGDSSNERLPRVQKILRHVKIRLDALINPPHLDDRLLKELVRVVVSDFHGLEPEAHRYGLFDVVLKGLDQASYPLNRSIYVLKEFATQVGSQHETAMIDLLLNLPVQQDHLRKTAEFLTQLNADEFRYHIASLIRVLREMLDVLHEPGLNNLERKDGRLPNFVAWQSNLTNPSEKKNLVLQFQQQLRSALTDVCEVSTRFFVGVSYLSASAAYDEELYIFLKSTLENNGHKVATWLAGIDSDLTWGRGRFLANFIDLGYRISRANGDSGFISANAAVQSLGDIRRQFALLSQLNNYLADADVPGHVKRSFREQVEEIKRTR